MAVSEIELVNSVLRSHEAPELGEFRLCFNGAVPQEQIEWLRFASAKRVRRLELKFSKLGMPVSAAILTVSFSAVAGFSSLRSLSLEGLMMPSGTVTWFLKNCPSLETLAVIRSVVFVELRVCSLMLKHLEISNCGCLKRLRISAPNLRSLTVTKLQWLFLDNAPKLMDVSINTNRQWDRSVRPVFSSRSCCIPQLDVLSFGSRTLNYNMARAMLHKPSNLRKLNLEIGECGDYYHIGLISMLTASPQLQELVLKLLCSCKPYWSGKQFKISKRNPSRLKSMEFINYCGRDCDVKVVEYVTKKCPSLERIAVSVPTLSMHQRCGTTAVQQQISRDVPETQLRGILPEHTELVIH